MRSEFLRDLVWRGQGLELTEYEHREGDIVTGKLDCSRGSFPITHGVPELLAELGDEEKEVQSLFSDYWEEHRVDEISAEKREWHAGSFRSLVMPDEPDSATSELRVREYLSEKKRILDVGCGNGFPCLYYRANDEQRWFNVDFGRSAYVAQAYLGRHPANLVVRASLFELPFHKASFDLIYSDGVLHHTHDPRAGFAALVDYLAPGGDIAVALLRRQTPFRDFADDYIRRVVRDLDPDEIGRLCEAMASMGRELQEDDATIEVPAGLGLLGIAAGRYSLHQFVHTNFIKLFYSGALSRVENINQGRDWYEARYAWKYADEEVVRWFEESDLSDITVWEPASVGERNQLVRVKGTKPR